jgi:cyclopropane fatty-acyl-phospholipid synthase-like methyltransferase
MSERLDYLEPYQQAAKRHGAGFGSLLWASPHTQAARFEAICRLVDLNGRNLLDVGCGRGDFLDYLIGQRVKVASYVGIEGVPELAEAARTKGHDRAQILQADFVAEPARLFVGAQVIVFSGSLNTMDVATFYSTLKRAFDAAGEMVVFNFLCSSKLAGADYLVWHRVEEVMEFARTLSARVRKLEDYLPGDCTVAIGSEG